MLAGAYSRPSGSGPFPQWLVHACLRAQPLEQAATLVVFRDGRIPSPPPVAASLGFFKGKHGKTHDRAPDRTVMRSLCSPAMLSHSASRSLLFVVVGFLLTTLLFFSLYTFRDAGHEAWVNRIQPLTPFTPAAPVAPPESSAPPAPSGIPTKLWYKLGPNGLSKDGRAWTSSCIDLNPGYDVEFMTDSSADRWVENTFNASNPELVEIFLGLPGGSRQHHMVRNVTDLIAVPIFKADLLRYLLLFAEGGVYNDLDVSCEVPISEWIPDERRDETAVVVGWEFDVGWGDHFIREFATWTIMAAPRSPHIWAVVDDIVEGFRKNMREHNVTVGGLTRDVVGDVVDATGPRRFTRGLMRSVKENFNATQAEIELLMDPKLLGDVLVLPGYAFAASSNKYGEAAAGLPPPLVKHHYAGSWKNPEGGEST